MKGIKCAYCKNFVELWCDLKADSPDPDLVRDCIGFEQITNGDKIRAMSDEKLAWELMTWRFDAFGKAEGNQSTLPDSQKTILEYLKQPVEAKEIVENCVSCQINLD